MGGNAMEIERKFLVSNPPMRISKINSKNIIQSYLSIEPEVRIRKITKGESSIPEYYLTVKGEGTLSRSEYETPIYEEIYNNLIEKKLGISIRKRRVRIHLPGGYVAELDEYMNINGLEYIVEVEFENIGEAHSFIPPQWFGKEVTDDIAFKNKNLIWK